MPLGIGLFRYKTLSKLLGTDKTGAEKFAPAPGNRAHPKHLAACREGEAEQFWHRQRPDLEANAVVGDVDDHAFDPWRIGRRDDEPRPPILDPFVLALAEVFTVSGHAAAPSGYRKAKLLSGGYREKLIMV